MLVIFIKAQTFLPKLQVGPKPLELMDNLHYPYLHGLFFWLQSTPPPLVDWSYVPTLVLAVILVLVAATALAARAADGKQSTRLPGPQALPFLGTRWLFWSRYKMNKLHEAYEGEIIVAVMIITLP